MTNHTHKRLFALLLCFAILMLTSCNGLPSKTDPKTIRATVVEIEKYGHAVLDVTAQELFDAGYALGDLVGLRFGSSKVEIPFFDGYYTSPGNLMLRGKSPELNVTVCINYGRFCEDYSVEVGDKVRITLAEKGALLSVQEVCKLEYSNDRNDFASDEVFANFREVTVGGIAEGKLFRSSSPINNKISRARYSSAFISEALVSTVLNLSDSYEDIEEYLSADDLDSQYYRGLYDAGKVIALDLDADFTSQEFASTVAQGLIFLSNNAAPFSIHCTEGKDRTGFVCMIVEALMGATLEEITNDYMTTFENYFGITEEEPERYRAILEYNLLPMMCHVVGVETFQELDGADLELAANEYLLNAGMTKDQISALKEKLS